jgi:hypothetical protein
MLFHNGVRLLLTTSKAVGVIRTNSTTVRASGRTTWKKRILADFGGAAAFWRAGLLRRIAEIRPSKEAAALGSDGVSRAAGVGCQDWRRRRRKRRNSHRAPNTIRASKRISTIWISPELPEEPVVPALTGGRVGRAEDRLLEPGVGSMVGEGVGLGVRVALAEGVAVRRGEACPEGVDRGVGATETNTNNPASTATSTAIRNRIEPTETALRRTSLSKPQCKANWHS